MRIPVLWFWKKKVMMINSSTGLVRCFILEREPAKMMRGRPGIGKSLQSWGISMLSMHLEHSGWKRGSGDSGQAVEWLTKAANAEHSAAQYVLGKLYQDGVYFNKDMDQAMKWFRSAAELGNEYAAYRMGCLLLLGEEIPKDVEAAVKWLSLSAEKGNPYAQYRLGMLYLKGEEYSPQVEVAMKWLQQAAEQKKMGPFIS